MSHVQDRWMVTGPNGRKVKSDRWGHGKRWLARWDERGTRRSKAFTTKDAAESHLARIRADQDRGIHVLTTRATLADYGDGWVTHQVHQRASSAEQMESRWRLHIRPTLGDLRLTDITRADVQSAVTAWSAQMAPSTVRIVYGYLAGIMKTALADHLVRETPCKAINLPPLEREKVVPLSTAQVHLIAAQMPDRYRAMVYLAAASGLRSAELRGLTTDRLTFADGRLRLRVDRQLVTTAPTFGPPKTLSSDRTVAVGERTAEIVRRHMAEHPPHSSGVIFTGREHRPMSRSTAADCWTDATVGMGLKDRSGWHELRHHHASLLIAAGLSPTAVAARLGHKDATETLQTYAHLWETDDERSVAAAERSLWPLVVAGIDRPEQPADNHGLRIIR